MPSADASDALDLPRIERLGEDAVLLRFGTGIDAASNARVHSFSRQLDTLRPPWLIDVVPAYASLALFVDATAWPENCDPQTEAIRWLGEQTLSGSAFVAARLVSIDVHYGGGDGPDLESVARHSRLAPADVISRHAAARYTVAMLGFAPGFPYLIGMDPTLAVPRLATPRAHVPAGSVAIGGAQTGIYPRSGPGGWHIIGRTTLELFDPARDPPALLAPGDQVRFVPAADPR